MELLPSSKEADLPWDDISSTDGVTCWQQSKKKKKAAVLLAATSSVGHAGNVQ